MRVSEVRALARAFVLEEASDLEELVGAYFAGSINWYAEDAQLPASSDVDLVLVFESERHVREREKFLYHGVLIETTRLPRARLGSAEQVLGDCNLASAFRTPNVILDPSGYLARLQAAVAREFARRVWVRTRCEAMHQRMLDMLGYLPQAPGLYERVVGWLFGTGHTPVIVLLAALRNPTVRKRYAAARQVLLEYGYADFYEELLDLLGCRSMDRGRVEHHLSAVAQVFDAASRVMRSEFPFGADLTDKSRRIAIDGSLELIEAGLYREAVFWLVATYARCEKVFVTDAPERAALFEGAYRDLRADLGVESLADMERRAERTRALLPHLDEVVEAIIAANPDLID